ncbi:hypothetical protein [Desulfitobacterium metallireducens]|uniref:Uncharacterized protein n=1 Tax=Desulfitobacterium metallireducens DSM 15288 TaxID=871968 RepID=W0ECB7_9FIRM|nr:hypothetical protein [Desulfitobacterium metallireducens]AHF08525.1 hypothetical protein DESME_06875 [Desulfitobacterium metallireducens DSM 15288]
MSVNYHYIKIKVRGFQTEKGQYRPHIIAGTLSDVEDCPEKCDCCADLRKVKKMMKRSVFKCHRLYEILERRNRLVETMGMEEATDFHFAQLADMKTEQSNFRKNIRIN